MSNRFYLEDVTDGCVFTQIFSATSKSKAMELLSEYGSGFDVIAIKIVNSELMERYGLTEEPTEEVSEPDAEESIPESENVSEQETPTSNYVLEKDYSKVIDGNRYGNGQLTDVPV